MGSLFFVGGHPVQLNVWLVSWVYGISILVGYLIPNPIYTYILNI